MEHALSEILRVAPSSLSRLHFHSLGLHLVASRAESRWQNEESAVVTGALTAGLKVCNVTSFGDGSKFKLLSSLSFVSQSGKQLSFATGVAAWKEGDIKYC